MKICKDCGKEKDEWEFECGINKSTGRPNCRTRCRECRNKRENIRRKPNWPSYKYGMTVGHYELMLKSQDNKCAICGKELTKPCIDHNHKTGKVRGILCRSCNTGLGLFQDNFELLRKAAVYLERNK